MTRDRAIELGKADAMYDLTAHAMHNAATLEAIDAKRVYSHIFWQWVTPTWSGWMQTGHYTVTAEQYAYSRFA